MSNRIVQKALVILSALVCMLVAGFGLQHAQASTRAQFALTSFSGVVGDTVSTTVQLRQNSMVASFVLTLRYDPAQVAITHANAGALLAEGVSDVYYDNTQGVLRLAFAQANDLTQGGSVLQLQFQLLTEASNSLTLTVDQCYSLRGIAVDTTITQGQYLARHNGWLGDYYYTNGKLVVSRWIGDYYVGADGKCYYNKWAGDYYCGSDGKCYYNKWAGDYYCGADGKYVKNRWIGDYYVGADGKCYYNKWAGDYYCGSDGKCYYSKWAGDYYCGADGKYVKNRWIGDYYVGADGKCYYNKWAGDYYCGSDGKCYYSKWAGDYYCGADGKYAKNQWVQIGDDWYYFLSDGKAAKGTVTIGDKQEVFSDTGVWQQG